MGESIHKADVKLAEEVIEAYAGDLMGLTVDECNDLEINSQQSETLRKVLGRGKYGVVTDEDRGELAKSGFSDTFIQELAGADGKKALRERVKWFGDNITNKWLRIFEPSINERWYIAYELENIGAVAEPIVDQMVESLLSSESSKHPFYPFDLARAIAKAGPKGYAAILLLSRDKTIGDSNPKLRGAIIAALASKTPRLALDMALESKDSDVRRAVIDEISKFGQSDFDDREKVVEMLDSRLKDLISRPRNGLDEDMEVNAIADALVKIASDNNAILRNLIGYISLESETFRSPVPYNFSESLSTLGAKIVPLLIGCLPKGKISWERDKGTQKTNMILKLLTKLNYEAGRQALPAVIESIKFFFPLCFNIIGANQLFLNKDSMCIDKYLTDYLNKMGDEAVAFLVLKLEDPDNEMRIATIQVLGEMREKAFMAIPVLDEIREKCIEQRECEEAKKAYDKILEKTW